MESAISGSTLRRLAAAGLLVVVAGSSAAILGACGKGGGKEDVEGLLDRAFRQSIRSADVKIDAQLGVSGLSGFERPVRLQATGPYIGVKRALPKLDIDLRIGAQGAGQTVESGVLSTSDRAFVKFGGAFYEQPRADVARANRRLRAGPERGRGALRDLGLDPRRWVVDARDEGEETIAGVESRHVSGKLDTRRLFSDLNQFVARSAGAVGGRRADVPDPLSREEIDRLSEIVRSPSFDVYVGKDDDVVRRISAGLDIRVPERDRAQLGGIESGSLRFSLELADVNGHQQVRAPAESRPIGDLTKALGGLGALAGGAAGGGDAGGQSNGRSKGGAGGGPSGSGGSTEATPGADGLRRYSDCLDEAPPNDTAALSRCAELLR